MNAATFSKIGETLHGPAWQGALACSLKIGARSVYRYARGESDVPETVARALVGLLYAHAAECKTLADSVVMPPREAYRKSVTRAKEMGLKPVWVKR